MKCVLCYFPSISGPPDPFSERKQPLSFLGMVGAGPEPGGASVQSRRSPACGPRLLLSV